MFDALPAPSAPPHGQAPANGLPPLPHNIQAEQALLGGLLIDNNSLDRICTLPEHFYDEVHGCIFEAIRIVTTSGQRADPTTLKPHVEDIRIETDGCTYSGLHYLGVLARNAVTVRELPSYADTVRELWQRREMMVAAHDMICRAASAEPLADIVADGETALHAVTAETRSERAIVGLGSALQDAILQANAAYERGGGLLGLSTGLPSLDRQLGGLAPGNLLIIAGRPAMGKTALALNIAHNAARGLDTASGEVTDAAPVGFFSMEMGATELAMRIAAETTGLSSSDIRAGRLTPTDIHALMRAGEAGAKVPLYIDQSGGMTIGQLAIRARRMKRQHGIQLLVIDYLQLMSGTSRGGNRVQEVTDITVGLKALAKELELPVIALSQLSRKVEERQDKRPQLADLRESGSIEQDADIVMFVYRDEYYVANAKPDENNPVAMQDWRQAMARAQGRAEVIIGKNRHGKTGTVEMRFDGRTTTFRCAPDGDAGQSQAWGRP
jgi:replicative DNA helicase